MYIRQILYIRGGQLDDIREPQLWRELRQEPSIDDDSPHFKTPLCDGLFFFCSSKYHILVPVMNQLSLQNLFKCSSLSAFCTSQLPVYIQQLAQTVLGK
jgi:hypothetical protein